MKPLFYLDGLAYRVGVTSLQRNAEVKDGGNAGESKAGGYIRDIIGTYYNFTMELSVFDSDAVAYNALYEVLTAPVESHAVELPYGQTTLSFEAYVQTVADSLSANGDAWEGLSVTFLAKEPQRKPG